MTIRVAGPALELHYDDFAIPLTHYHFDVFTLGRIPGRVTPVSGAIRFRTNTAGAIETVEIPFESQLPHQVFTRQ